MSINKCDYNRLSAIETKCASVSSRSNVGTSINFSVQKFVGVPFLLQSFCRTYETIFIPVKSWNACGHDKVLLFSAISGKKCTENTTEIRKIRTCFLKRLKKNKIIHFMMQWIRAYCSLCSRLSGIDRNNKPSVDFTNPLWTSVLYYFIPGLIACNIKKTTSISSKKK